MLTTIIRSAKDFFDKKILLLSFIPMLVSASIIGFIFFLFSGTIHGFFIWVISHIPFISGDLVVSVTQSFFGVIVFYELMIISSVLFVGIVADGVVDRINEKYYHLEKRGFGTFSGSMFKAIKSNILFIVLFMVLLPTMFIPFFNIFIHLLLWSILIKEPMFYDSLSFYATKTEFNNIKKRYKLQTWIISFISAALFLIPVFGVFLYILQLIIFTHFNLKNLKGIQNDR